MYVNLFNGADSNWVSVTYNQKNLVIHNLSSAYKLFWEIKFSRGSGITSRLRILILASLVGCLPSPTFVVHDFFTQRSVLITRGVPQCQRSLLLVDLRECTRKGLSLEERAMQSVKSSLLAGNERYMDSM